MTKLEDSEQFIWADQIPSFDVSTPALDVYKQLAVRERGDFILNEGSRQYLVNAETLAKQAMIGAGVTVRKAEGGAKVTIGTLCAMPAAQASLMPIESVSELNAFDAESMEANPEEKIYRVLRGGDQIGYFVKYKSIIERATKLVYYVCANGHRNTDPDHGFCYFCPAPIDSTERS